MSGFFIQALERKPWERHVQTNAKSTFLAQNALPSPTLVPSSLHDDGCGLPTAVSGSNIGPERPVIRWMSAKYQLSQMTKDMYRLLRIPSR